MAETRKPASVPLGPFSAKHRAAMREQRRYMSARFEKQPEEAFTKIIEGRWSGTPAPVERTSEGGILVSARQDGSQFPLHPYSTRDINKDS